MMARWVGLSGAGRLPGCSSSCVSRWGSRVLPQKSLSDLGAVDMHLGDHVVGHKSSPALRLAQIEPVAVLLAVYLHYKYC